MAQVKQEVQENMQVPLNGKSEDNDEGDDEDFSNDPPEFSCDFCSASFVTRISLNRHMILTHEGEQKYYVCSVCNLQCLKKEELQNHIANEHGGAQFSCMYCQRNFSRRDHMQKHIENVHENVHPDKLAQSDQKSSNIKISDLYLPELNLKAEPVNGENGFDSGEDSNSNFSNQEENGNGAEYGEEEEEEEDSTLQITVEPELPFGNDEDEEEEEEGYYYNGQMVYNNNGREQGENEDEEEDVGGDLDSLSKIKASLNGIRVDRKHHCECGASFLTKVNLQRHMSCHSNRNHVCSYCQKSFVRKEHLSKHLSSVHSGMKFTCEFCGKDISRKDHLIRHIRNVHPTEYLGIPPELAQSQNLQETIKSLQDQGLVISDKAILSMQPKPKKPYLSCDVCEDTFTHIDELHLHQSTVHSDIRRFRCAFCPKGFKRKEHLNKHEVLHTGEKNFSCPTCAKDFPRKDALNDHIRRIHGTDNSVGVEYPCNFCDKVFLQRPNLLRHLKNQHQILINFPSENSNGSINGSILGLPALNSMIPSTSTASSSSNGKRSLPKNFQKNPYATGMKRSNTAFDGNPMSLLKVNMSEEYDENEEEQEEDDGPQSKIPKLLRAHFAEQISQYSRP